MLKYNYPILAFFVAHWPAMIFLPSVMAVMVALALITRAWDKRDEAARLQQQHPA